LESLKAVHYDEPKITWTLDPVDLNEVLRKAKDAD